MDLSQCPEGLGFFKISFKLKVLLLEMQIYVKTLKQIKVLVSLSHRVKGRTEA